MPPPSQKSRPTVQRLFRTPFFAGWLLLIGGLPFIFLPSLFDTFELPKFVFFFCGVGLLTILSAFDAPRRGREGSRVPAASRGQALLVPMALFYGVLLASSLLSVDIYSSLFGTYGRHEGFITYTLYFFLCLLCLQHGLTSRQFRRLSSALVIVAGLLSLHALLQHFGLDIFGAEGEDRSFSTMGHPNFLGGYLAMLFPFLSASQLTQRGARRLGITAVYTASAFALLYTYSRAAWLSAAAGLAVFFWLFPHPRKRDLLLKGVAAAAVVFLFASIPSLSRSSFTLPSRLFSMFDTSNPTVVTRTMMWHAALHAAREKPVLGFGLDTFKYAFLRHKPEGYARFEGIHMTSDKAHNEVLHMLATTGFLGLFAYFWFWATLLLLLWRSRREDKHWSAVWLGALTAYLVQALFSFSVVALGATLFAFCGLAAAGPPPPVTRTPSSVVAPRSFSLVSLTGGLSLLAVAIVFAAVRVGADQAYLDLRVALAQSDPRAVRHVDRMLRFPYAAEYWVHAGKAFELAAEGLTAWRADYLNRALWAYETGRIYFPLDPYFYSFQGSLIPRLLRGEQGALSALSLMRRARELDRRNPVFMNNLGSLYWQLGLAQKALPLLEEAVRILPSYALAWANLGISYAEVGKPEKAEEALLRAIEADPTLLGAWRPYLKLLASQGRAEEAKDQIARLQAQGVRRQIEEMLGQLEGTSQ